MKPFPGIFLILSALALTTLTPDLGSSDNRPLARVSKAITVSASDLKAVDVTVSVGKKNYTIYCYGNISGKVRPSGANLSFTSYKDLIKKYKKDPQKYAAKLKVAKALNKAGKVVCDGPPPPPTPTPTPGGPTPTRTRTPTPRPPDSGCDGSGNTTSFGIPSGLTGNKSRGSSEWNSACISCHSSPKRGKSYSAIRSSLSSEPSMLGLRETDQEVADLAAYLNCP